MEREESGGVGEGERAAGGCFRVRIFTVGLFFSFLFPSSN
jgi:hypothetical protein